MKYFGLIQKKITAKPTTCIGMFTISGLSIPDFFFFFACAWMKPDQKSYKTLIISLWYGIHIKYKRSINIYYIAFDILFCLSLSQKISHSRVVDFLFLFFALSLFFLNMSVSLCVLLLPYTNMWIDWCQWLHLYNTKWNSWVSTWEMGKVAFSNK